MTFKHSLLTFAFIFASASAQAHPDHSHYHANLFQQLTHFLSSPDHMALSILLSVVAFSAIRKWSSKKTAAQKLRNKK